MSNSIELKINNKVAFISLNRPDVFNSFNREMALQLITVLDKAENKLVKRIFDIVFASVFFLTIGIFQTHGSEVNSNCEKILARSLYFLFPFFVD